MVQDQILIIQHIIYVLVINNGIIICYGRTPLPSGRKATATLPISFSIASFSAVVMALLKSSDFSNLVYGTEEKTISTVTINCSGQSSPAAQYIAMGY